MSDTNSQDDSSENPFEAHLGPEVPDPMSSGFNPYENTDPQTLIPPVKPSYWIGASILGLLSIMSFLVPTVFYDPISQPLLAFLMSFIWICTPMIVLLPMALIRLALHRRNIAKAIQAESYPGNQTFGVGYLMYSLFMSFACLAAGCFLFFGICTGLFLGSQWVGLIDFLAGPLLILSAILSVVTSGYLLNLGIPKYR